MDGVTATAAELNLVDGSTAGNIVNSKAVIYGTNGEVNVTTLQIGGTSITSTAAELNLVDGSSAGNIVNSKAVIYGSAGEVNVKTLKIDGTSITSTASELNILDGVTATAAELNLVDGSSAGNIVNSKAVIYGTAGEVNVKTLKIDGTSITSTALELNLVDGSTAGNIVNSKAVIYGTNGEVNATTLQIGGTSITSTAAELNILDGVTATATELNYLDITTLGTSANSKALTQGSDGNVNVAGNLIIVDGTNDLDVASHDGTNGLKLGGTLVTATAEELNTYILNVELSDISAVASCFVVVPKAGTIIKVSSIIDGTTVNATTIGLKINNAGSNFDTITIPTTASVPTISSCVPTGDNTVSANDYIEISSGGGTGNSVKAVFTIEIQYWGFISNSM